jgi:5,10-methylene-tetrahydrofolate dehydrogenase/methenyl tetrahydrofolate cyclohydrolase
LSVHLKSSVRGFYPRRHPRRFERSVIVAERGAAVIDASIRRPALGRRRFRRRSAKTSFVTPAPGAVGPMTVTMLLVSKIVSAENARVPAFGS